MKKIVALLLSVFLIMGTAAAVYADDVKHFEDGTSSLTFMDSQVTFEVPSNWEIFVNADGSITLAPISDGSIFFIVMFTNYESGDLSDSLENMFLTQAADSILEGVSNSTDGEPAEIYTLDNGESIGGAYYVTADTNYASFSKRCGSYIFLMGMVVDQDKYDDAFIDDAEMILSSARLK